MAHRNRENYNTYMRKWFQEHPGYYSTDERREYMKEYMRKFRAKKKAEKAEKEKQEKETQEK